MINITQDMITSIYKEDPKANPTDLNLLKSYVETYNLTSVPDKNGKGCWFVASDLALAKGLAKGNYSDYIARQSRKQIQMAGKHLTLRGESLRNYKLLLKQKGYVLSGSSVIIVDWKRALDYLQSRHLPSAKQHLEFHSENQMQTLLMSLASYTNLGLRQEASFNYKGTCVRIDILDTPNKVLYELKAASISPDHVKEKMKYLDVLELKDYKLVFVSPISCTRDAKNLIKANKRLSYMHVTDLASIMYQNILSLTPLSAMFYINQTLAPKFQRILPYINSQILFPGS